MTAHIQYNALSSEQWQSAIEQAPYHAFQQSWGYGQAAKQFGAGITRAALYHEDVLVGLAQLQTRRLAKLLPMSVCLRGPVWLGTPSDETKAALYKKLSRRYRIELWMPEGDDAAALNAAGKRQVFSPYHTVMLDLTQPLETLREQMDGKWRNRLVAAEGSSLKVNQLKDYRFLLEQETEQSAQKGYAALNPMLVPAYQFECGENSVLCLATMHKREASAALLCLIHGNSATYHIGWASADGKKANAHNLLLWQAIKQLKARGIRTLDLGGIHTEPDGAGIARFKMGAGGEVVSLAGTFF